MNQVNGMRCIAMQVGGTRWDAGAVVRRANEVAKPFARRSSIPNIPSPAASLYSLMYSSVPAGARRRDGGGRCAATLSILLFTVVGIVQSFKLAGSLYTYLEIQHPYSK